MIIAFDGNVFTGKTSLIKAFATANPVFVIDEYSSFLDDNTIEHQVKNGTSAIFLQEKYFNAEEKRSHILKHNEINLLDRSFVSMAGHIFALNIVFNIDIRNWFLQRLQVAVDSQKVLIPDIFCFVKCSQKLIKERVSKNFSRATDSLYYSDRYLSAIEYFNSAWSKKVDGITIDTSTLLSVELAKSLIQQISGCSQGKCSPKDVCAFVQDIFNQKF